MKACDVSLRTVVFCFLLALGQQVRAELNVSEAPSPEEMAARVRASRSMQPSSSEPATGETPAAARASDDVLTSSQMLAANGHWTLVPKSAVVHVPKELADRVVTAPSGTMVPWEQFLQANRSWLNNQEISVDEAAGKTALSPSVLKSWVTDNRVVVTTHQGGAISCKQANPAQP